MRIALVSTCALSTPPKAYGGTELMVAELGKGLKRLGHDVTVFATGDSCPETDLSYHFTQPIWPPNDLAEMRHASFAWREVSRSSTRFDVVHVNHATALPFQALMPAPTVLTVHHERVESLLEHYKAYPDVAYVAISQRQADLSPELTFRRVIHHGLDPDLYPAGDGQGGYVAFLGRFAPEKGTDLAIGAARRAGVPIHLGGVPHEVSTEYFEQRVKPHFGDPSVVWHGELSHGPKVGLLAGARALLVPILWEEPFGLVMIEAMLVGTPVIAFARGSAPEIIDEGVTGFVVHDEAQMAERIHQLDRIDRARCRARALERWSTERMARDYVSLYESLVPVAPQRRAAVRLFDAAAKIGAGDVQGRSRPRPSAELGGGQS